MDGMLPAWLMQLLGVPARKAPSELISEAWPTHEKKTAIRMPPEEFLSAPVTDLERDILRLAPRGMLYELNKQGLDRELDASRQFFSRNRSKPIRM